ncbi:MAG: hypothetical protein WC641_05385 [Patescibacteria group bacterium]
MFSLLKRFQDANPSAYERCAELTNQLEIAGAFRTALPLDVQYGGMIFDPLRRETGEFFWGFRLLDMDSGGARVIMIMLNYFTRIPG